MWTPACLIRLVQAVQVALGRGKRHHLPWEVILLAHAWPKLPILDLDGVQGSTWPSLVSCL